MKRILYLFIAVLLGFSCLSCDSSDDSSGSSVSINSVGWVLENIDESFFSADDPASAFINFWVNLEANSLVASDIDSIAIYAPSGTYWEFDDQSDIEYYFDTEDDTIGGWLRLYSSSHPDTVELGTYEFKINFTGGESKEYSLNIPAPGMTSTGGYSYCYSPENYDEVSGYKALPSKAVDLYLGMEGNVYAEFSVTDDIVYNAMLWFYDNSGDYIGKSAWLRDFETGAISSVLNGGDGFYTTIETYNFVDLSSSDIDFEDGYGIDDINSMRVVLTDGKQYEGESATYDSRSISIPESMDMMVEMEPQ